MKKLDLRVSAFLYLLAAMNSSPALAQEVEAQAAQQQPTEEQTDVATEEEVAPTEEDEDFDVRRYRLRRATVGINTRVQRMQSVSPVLPSGPGLYPPTGGFYGGPYNPTGAGAVAWQEQTMTVTSVGATIGVDNTRLRVGPLLYSRRESSASIQAPITNNVNVETRSVEAPNVGAGPMTTYGYGGVGIGMYGPYSPQPQLSPLSIANVYMNLDQALGIHSLAERERGCGFLAAAVFGVSTTASLQPRYAGFLASANGGLEVGVLCQLDEAIIQATIESSVFLGSAGVFRRSQFSDEPVTHTAPAVGSGAVRNSLNISLFMENLRARLSVGQMGVQGARNVNLELDAQYTPDNSRFIVGGRVELLHNSFGETSRINNLNLTLNAGVVLGERSRGHSSQYEEAHPEPEAASASEESEEVAEE